MSYQTEHQRMKPVLDLARRLDIATNPDPRAIFEAGNAGFQVWCTPQDHPKGWNDITMHPGAFSKACEYVGSVTWEWEDQQIVALELETSAYALADQKPDEYCKLKEVPKTMRRRTIFNRQPDIEWLKEKVIWLFAEASVLLPPFLHEPLVPMRWEPYVLAHFTAGPKEYVVIVSPERQPSEFCKPDYELARTLKVWDVGAFPVDVILRPDGELEENAASLDTDPAPGQDQKDVSAPTDDWLEANFEDRISGSGE